MNALILNETEIAELAALNASGTAQKCLSAIVLGDGRFALNADLLTDCGAGQTWEHYGAFLGGLELEEIS